jgi:hypothetical protein
VGIGPDGGAIGGFHARGEYFDYSISRFGGTGLDFEGATLRPATSSPARSADTSNMTLRWRRENA